ncbi:MAG: Gfo/Idh/MocA family oxidoreductase [Verrucomicrobia bacterium]|nr:Gfo/Idh/MocA family oxidoreductase [Verrucomicrobiota bacterium]
MADKLRVAVVGTGFGKHHVRTFQAHSRATVVAVCSTDQDRANESAIEVGVPKGYGDYRRMLDDHEIDALCIATHPAAHAELSMAALLSGRHVMCTKPLGVNLKEAWDVLQIARTGGCIHAIDQNLRFTPVTMFAKSLIDSGAIGMPLFANSSMFLCVAKYFSNAQASPNKNAWFRSRQRGGGFLLADAAHQFDRLLWYFGSVRTVSGFARTAMPRVKAEDGTVYECDADDSYVGVFEFENGMTATSTFTPVSWPGNERRLEVHGDRGSILLAGPAWDRDIKLATNGDSNYNSIDIPSEFQPADLPRGVSPGLYALVDRFVKACLDGAPMSPSFEDGYKTQELIEAVSRSGATGARQVLPLDPKPEELRISVTTHGASKRNRRGVC